MAVVLLGGALSLGVSTLQNIKQRESLSNDVNDVEHTEPPAEETPEIESAPPYQNDGFIFPDSGTEIISQQAIQGLSDDDLTYAINEIYARHGYIFRSSELRTYYEQFDWYSGDVPAEEFSTDRFNQIELQNWNLLVGERNDRKASDRPIAKEAPLGPLF